MENNEADTKGPILELLRLYEAKRDSGKDYSQMISEIDAKFSVVDRSPAPSSPSEGKWTVETNEFGGFMLKCNLKELEPTFIRHKDGVTKAELEHLAFLLNKEH